MEYRVYRKYRTEKKWNIITSYSNKRDADRHAQGIRDSNPNYYAMVRKIRK